MLQIEAALANIIYNRNIFILQAPGGLYYKIITIVNDISRVVRITIIGDATTWSVILMTLEVSFTIIIIL